MSSLFRINNNIAATFAQRQLTESNRQLDEANERLSSGLRINSAADDAAGLAVSEKFRQSIRGLGQAEKNAQDGISVLQTAEGGMESMTEKLQRIRELSIQSANDSLTDADRQLLQSEVDELVEEMDRTASTVQFNNRQLLKNGFGTVSADGTTIEGNNSLTFHTGANRDEVIKLTTDDIATTTAFTLGMSNARSTLLGGNQPGFEAIQITSQQLAESAIEAATRAINSLSSRRARVGAVQNRLESTIDFLQIQQENVQASESRIRDADLAEETVKRTRSNILLQAGTSVLSQANQTPQLALQLLN